MGAEKFVQAAVGKTAEAAYKAAVRAAVYDYGHDLYNGTISTTDGFTIVRVPAGEDPFEYAERHGFDFDKWGECGCIPLSVPRIKKLAEAGCGTSRWLLEQLAKKGGKPFVFFGLAAS